MADTPTDAQRDAETTASRVKGDAKGQFATADASPNPDAEPNQDGISSTTPTVIDKTSDATFKGHPHTDKSDPEDVKG